MTDFPKLQRPNVASSASSDGASGLRQDHGDWPGEDQEQALALDIVRSANIALWAAEGAEGNFAVQLWSPGAEEIYGFSAEQMLGRSYIDRFVGQQDREAAMEAHERTLRTGEVSERFGISEDHGTGGRSRTVIRNCFRIWDPKRGKYLLAELGINLDHKGEADDEREVVALQEEAMLEAETDRHQRTVGAFDCLNAAITEVTSKGGGRENIVAALEKAIPMALGGVTDTCVWLFDSQGVPGPATIHGAQRLDSLPFHLDKLVKRITEDRATRTSPIYDVYLRGDPTARAKLAPYTKAEGDGLARTYSVAPLSSTSDLFGLFAIVYDHDRDLSVKEKSVIKSLASHAGWALAVAAYAELLQQRREQEAERVRADTREMVVEAVLHTVGNDAFVLQGDVNKLLEEIAKTGLDKHFGGLVQQVQQGTAQLGAVMDELQQRIEAADRPIEVRILDEVRAVTNPLSMYLEVKVTVDVSPDLVASASRFLLREALRNLVKNAVQVMIEEDGGGRLRVSARAETNRSGDSVVHIDVEDDGPGVPIELRDLIWRRDVSRRAGGHGHGLAITQGLMTLLNGKVELLPGQSPLGGAHFRITLPVPATPPSVAPTETS
ncbi:MAG: ATP-binding protein [Actinomycetota bacterium]|nr:ATP-binding protein [Actinomycetota bacterium]